MFWNVIFFSSVAHFWSKTDTDTIHFIYGHWVKEKQNLREIAIHIFHFKVELFLRINFLNY